MRRANRRRISVHSTRCCYPTQSVRGTRADPPSQIRLSLLKLHLTRTLSTAPLEDGVKEQSLLNCVHSERGSAYGVGRGPI